jgi:membrane fusion protein (multidrug efflux system)
LRTSRFFLVLASLLITAPWNLARAQRAPIPIVVAEAKETAFVDEIEALGTLRANESVDLTANVTEIVQKIRFDDGQRVKKGDVLVEMLSAQEEALLIEARSTLNEAKLQYHRVVGLSKTGAVANATLDQNLRNYETAKARVAAIESQLRDLVITAPFDGVVGLRNISVGALVRPGDLITTIDDDSMMKLDFTVPSNFLPALKAGTPIVARTRAFAEDEFAGKIFSVGSRIDPATRSITVRAKIPNPDRRLKPGLLMLVKVQSNPRQAVTIPEEALMPEGRKNAVFVLDESVTPPVLEHREVEVGQRRAGEVEIMSGLREGEKVVTRGKMMAGPGAAVQVTAIAKGDDTLRDLLNQDNDAKP